jgi:hypothetical protein
MAKRPVEVPEFQIAKMTVKPGDVIVLKVNTDITEKQRTVIRERLKSIWPKNEVLVLHKDVTLGVMVPD